MKKLQLKLAKWLFNQAGYKIAAIKITPISNVLTYVLGDDVPKNVYTGVPTIFIEGDKELLRYLDITGYTANKTPLKRVYDVAKRPELIQSLPKDIVAEIHKTTIPWPAPPRI